MSTKSYLITGGAGFLGADLVHKLVAAGHRVRLLDDASRGNLARLATIKDDIETVQGDVRDPDAVIDAAANVDIVVHLAAVNGTENFYAAPDLVLDVGVRGMLNVIDACERHGTAKLIVASSSEVYQTPAQVPTDESEPLRVPDVMNPRYSYGGSKIISELLAVNYGRSRLNHVVIFRPHNVYGPDMGWEHVLPQFAVRAGRMMRAQPEGRIEFPIQGDGSQTRAFIYIDDFTDGLLTLIDKGEHLGLYHIGNPDEVAIADIATKVFEILKRDMLLVRSEEPQGATPRRCPDISRLRSLGFAPRVSIDEGLPKLLDWYLANLDQAPDQRG